jgi:hypothetical protein
MRTAVPVGSRLVSAPSKDGWNVTAHARVHTRLATSHQQPRKLRTWTPAVRPGGVMKPLISFGNFTHGDHLRSPLGVASGACATIRQVAGGLGFEPRQAESESAVLPLDDPPTGRLSTQGGRRFQAPQTRVRERRPIPLPRGATASGTNHPLPGGALSRPGFEKPLPVNGETWPGGMPEANSFAVQTIPPPVGSARARHGSFGLGGTQERTACPGGQSAGAGGGGGTAVRPCWRCWTLAATTAGCS